MRIQHGIEKWTTRIHRVTCFLYYVHMDVLCSKFCDEQAIIVSSVSLCTFRHIVNDQQIAIH